MIKRPLDNKVEFVYLLDFPIKKTFVCLNNSLNKELLGVAIKKTGSQRLLANIIKNSLNYPKINQNIISAWLRRNFLRLDIIIFLNDYTKLNIDLDSNILMLKGQSTSRPIISPKFPLILNKELASILANLYCDGSTNDMDSHTTEYVNQNYDLVSKLKNNLNLVFGKVNTSERYINETKVYNLRIPHYLGRLLHKKFNLDIDNVPAVIKDSSIDIKGKYLRSVFDDEGTISEDYSQIRLKMKNRSYVEDIKLLLESMGINSSQICKEKYVKGKFGLPCYYFTISGYYNLKKYLELISFDHSKKLIRLQKYLSKIKNFNYGHNANQKVLEILKFNGPISKNQIAIILNRNSRTIQHHLNKLLKLDLVKFKKVWRTYSYEYLWSLKK